MTITRNVVRSPRWRPGRVLVPALGAGLAVALAAAPAAPASAAEPAPGTSPLRSAVQSVVGAGAVGTTATVDDGRRRESASAGLAVRDPVRPMQPRDQVEIGSNTKTFMATIALQLVAEHRLRLTDSVERWLPGVVPGGRAITVRMLLNHTSGIFNYTEDSAWIEAALTHPERIWQPGELVAVAVQHPPYFAPGAGWEYSNTNYILVGMILRKVTGMDPAELVARRIAAPLGLRHTYLPVPGQNTDGAHRAHSYWVLFNPDGTRTVTDVTTPRNLSWAGTAGAMISTTGELARFFQALLGGRLLPPAQLTQMRTTVPVVPAGQPDPQHAGYGLGLFTADTPCGTVWGHGGDTLGTSTRDWFTPDGSRSTVSAVNTRPDFRQDPTVPGYLQLARAEGGLEEQGICQMYGTPVPTAPTASTAAAAGTRTAPTWSVTLPWTDVAAPGIPSARQH